VKFLFKKFSFKPDFQIFVYFAFSQLSEVVAGLTDLGFKLQEPRPPAHTWSSRR